MRKLASIAGLAACLVVAAALRASADDELMRRIGDRLAQTRARTSPIDTLRTRLAQCWNLPPALRDAPALIVTVQFSLKIDGSLAAPPVVTNHSQNPLFDKAAESALAAVRKCAPYTFLPTASYNQWKDIIVDFDPRVLIP